MKALFLAQQDSETRRWSPVGRLTRDDAGYKFVYTKGVKDITHFAPFGRMSELDRPYVSKVLFPMFTNRLLPKSRAEYSEYLTWLGLSEQSHTVLGELERTSGVRATDNFEVIPLPQPNSEGKYEVYVFARGLSHLPPAAQEWASTLSVGDTLFICPDVQNKYDSTALLLRTDDPISVVGYVPKAYSHDLSEIVRQSGPQAVRVTVERVNERAPMQYRILCKIVADWPSGFVPCSIGSFEPYEGSENHPLIVWEG